jgi:hypothetical protein
MKRDSRFKHLSLLRTATIVSVVLVLMVPTTSWSKGKLVLGVPGGKGGVVTTSEPNAARVGAEILRNGGNAIDAAAAVQFALNVVEPQSSGIGGGGFMVIYLAKQRKTVTVDSREKAPMRRRRICLCHSVAISASPPPVVWRSVCRGRFWGGHRFGKMGDHRPERGAGAGDRAGPGRLSRRPPAGGEHRELAPAKRNRRSRL